MLSMTGGLSTRMGVKSMGERYWVTGTQIGLLMSSISFEDKNKIVDKIVENQFITNCWTDEEKQVFKNLMDELLDTEICHWQKVKLK